MELQNLVVLTDADDTGYASSRNMHHPIYVKFIKEYFPEKEILNFDDWMDGLVQYGFVGLYKNIIQLSDEEINLEYKFWKKRSMKLTDNVEFDLGYLDAVRSYQNNGGLLGVISHSHNKLLEHYFIEKSGLNPKLIIGSDTQEVANLKPAPDSSLYAQKYFSKISKQTIDKDRILVMGDLPDDLNLAINSGVNFIGAGWIYQNDKFKNMVENDGFEYVTSTDRLKEILLTER